MPVLQFNIHKLIPYISWTYFFHAWRFPAHIVSKVLSLYKEHSPQSWLREDDLTSQAVRLLSDAQQLLQQWDGKIYGQAIFQLCKAYADGDDLLLDNIRIPLLRQQTPQANGSPMLCLADFVRPLSGGTADTVGIFATTFHDESLCIRHKTDPYETLLVQTLADRLAEASAELIHLRVRREIWGYAPYENLTPESVLRGDYQGIRPAIGYPSLPDQSVIFLLDRLLHLDKIGISLTSNGAMTPHASVCGLMLAHPAAHYFNIGRIGQDQLEDYSRRRNLPIKEMKKYLGHLLTENDTFCDKPTTQATNETTIP